MTVEYPEDEDPWLKCERLPEPDHLQKLDITEDEIPF